MATVYIRNVPDDVAGSLGEAAKASGVSKNAAAIRALRRGLDLDQLERAELVAEMLARRPETRGAVDAARIIREERGRR